MPEKDDVQWVDLKLLRPNNWFINQLKLDRVREAWQCGEEQDLPPVLVADIDGEMGLIDGHSRAFAAFERGETHIRAQVSALEDIDGSQALYRHIHRQGPVLGIETIADLEKRIIGPDTHRRLWVGYCNQWLEEHDAPSGQSDEGGMHGE